MAARAYEHRPLGAVSLSNQPPPGSVVSPSPAAQSAGSATSGAGGSTTTTTGGRAFGSTSLGDSASASTAAGASSATNQQQQQPPPSASQLAPQPPIHPHTGGHVHSLVAPNGMLGGGGAPPSGQGPPAGSNPAAIAAAQQQQHQAQQAHAQAQAHAHAQAQAQAHAAHVGGVLVPAVGPGGQPVPPLPSSQQAPSGVPPQGAPHPSAQRLNDLLEFVKAEFEQVAGEGGILRAQREEYEAMIHSHASELNAMRAMVYDLERKYHEDKRLMQDETIRLQEENLRLRHQLDSSSSSARTSIPTPGGTASLTAPTPGTSGRTVLPPMTAPLPSLTRPASGNAFFPPPPPPPPPRAGTADLADREATNGHGSEYPNKRMRGGPSVDEDDRKRGRHGGHAPPTYPSSRPSSAGSTTAGHQPPPLHHPAPRPPVGSSALPSVPPSAAGSEAATSPRNSTTVPSSAAPGTKAPTPGPAAVAVKEEKTEPPAPASSTAAGFDPETAPKDLKKEGSDWMTMFNPNVKRVLDVGLVHTLVHDSVVCCVRFSPDGKALATGCNRNTTLYDTKTGAKIAILFDESSNAKADNYIRSVSFSPDGKYLATGSEDRIVRIWNLAQKRILQVFQGHKSEIYSLTFSPDGRRLVSGSGDKTARMWDLETGSCIFTLTIDDITIAENGPVDAGVTSVVFSPDGKFLAAGSLDTVVRIWDAETGQLLDKLKGHMDSVYSVAFSPDGRYLVSGSLDKTLKMFDIGSLRHALATGGRDAPVGEGGKTKCLTTLQGHKDYVLSVDISPDGAWIVSGSKDRGVQFWDPKTAKAQFMLQGHKNSVISVAVSSAGGLVATGSGDWSARIWSYERIA
ncbi:hypothetical protein JCM10908_000469 [Rhodotorula pacifica]|uniref:uncharacterized protein n=1 Tax=Rhodotorula pacifica TaxID=1495444 RepID=UPI00317D997F